MTKITLTFLLFAVLFSQGDYAQKHQLSVAQKEDKICDLIASLPEVIKADNYMIKTTKGKRHLQTYIEDRPRKDGKYYQLTVSEDNGMNMVPHFKFMVDSKTYAIYYWDVINDKLIPLAKWRKQLAAKNHN
ncbi:hypothetical protein JN11_02094 [Mucilaginibacter frigoritolerans]|uniref:Uncharacterized protein n=1 Tax=Mucilaginibacter frigoritolerans TaxID=652788 RepID=A0A562U531_9SPHI|nr:hypothetical protein [Mucilaginibacter frigoritolerans]TWJ00834.1 hypothetical protein JN11_02094 [Mucilaginibacter frigoritolerans]